MSHSSPSTDPLFGLNPEHLLDIAAEPASHADPVQLHRQDLPSLEEVAAAFPDLEIVELIGHGGMSAVFRARQPQLERVVALKVLPKFLAATPGFAERFTREGRVLARLAHPHIVTVHDFGERGGFWFLIMEHVDGVNLRQAMRAGRFTPEQALEVIPAICDALQFAHRQGVLHRDIKPENILLDAKGGVKIVDFGIAKILGEDADGAMLLTQSGAKLGTAPYMAPEQIEKPSSVDHRADIYSLGVVFYEMLTGELPLGRFAAPSELASVGGNMDEVVFRALAKERGRRQQSAEEFKTQVEGAGSAPQQNRKIRSDAPFEYRSKRKIGGLPLLHVTHGRDSITGEVLEARGIIAVGDKACGVFAFGGVALGVVACGGLARGLVAIGGAAFGLISIGGFALGLLFAFGGFSVGALALGGGAVGWHACGGMVFGWHGFGAWVYAHTGHGGQVHALIEMPSLQAMPPLTIWLASLLRYTWLSLILWLPLSAGMWMVQWWARHEVTRLKNGQTNETSIASLIWLLAALVVFCGVVGAAVLAQLSSLVTGSSSVIMPILVTLTGLLSFATAVPLWLRLVPTNGLYGLRLASTMTSEERWLDANAVWGKHQLGWSFMLMAAGLAGFHQLPRHQESYPWAAFALVLTSVVATAFSIGWWLRHHPVNGQVKNTSRWAKCAGQFFTAIVVAYFIKGFVFDLYRMAGRSETGVTQGSHWIASKLDTGFDPSQLVAFEHDSGYDYIARVVRHEEKGLLLRRGGVDEAFFVPWDRIIGKLLFSHFTPSAVKAAGEPEDVLPAPKPPIEGTSNALLQKPLLRFLQITPNGGTWQQPIYSPQGQLLDSDETMKLKTWGSFTGSDDTKDSDLCWIKFWFEHPDFDEASIMGVTLSESDGQLLLEANRMNSRSTEASKLQHSVVSPGRMGDLPDRVNVTLSYSIGPWRQVTEIKPDSRTSTTFGDGTVITGFGDDSENHAFIGWSKRKNDKELYDAVAVLKSSRRIRAFRRSGVTVGDDKNLVETSTFSVPLREVKAFQMRSREVQTVEFRDVMIPPLQ